MTRLEVQGVSVRFGATPVLTEASLTVPDGSFTTVLGASGSGKTTLLRVIAGFQRPDAGTVRLGDVTVAGPGIHVPPERRRIGYVPQEGALFPHLRVATNVGFGLRRAERTAPRIAELLEMVGLSGLERRYPHELSGGQQQRVALARALAIRPALVLLDEPFSSLDASLRTTVRAEIQSVLRAAGATAVLVTHDQDEALSMSDQVAVLRGGIVAQEGTPEALYAQPLDAELAQFLGIATLIGGTVAGDGDSVATPLGQLLLRDPTALPAGASVTVLVRPEQVTLVRTDDEKAVHGTVGRCEYYGHDAVLSVDVPDLELLARVPGVSAEPIGTRVAIRVVGPVTAWMR